MHIVADGMHAMNVKVYLYWWYPGSDREERSEGSMSVVCEERREKGADEESQERG